jgi:hypothetical protein
VARLELTVQEPVHGYPALPLAANGADVVFTAAGVDFADGAAFPLTERELLLVRNANVGAQTVTVSSVVDGHNRTGDITAYSLGAGEVAAFFFNRAEGWRASDGKAVIEASAADVEFAVVRLPA